MIMTRAGEYILWLTTKHTRNWLKLHRTQLVFLCKDWKIESRSQEIKQAWDVHFNEEQNLLKSYEISQANGGGKILPTPQSW